MRHCANPSSVKHATWWKIHLKPHVYKGFPFISLSTPPIFPYLTFLIARCKSFRLAVFFSPSFSPMLIRVSPLYGYYNYSVYPFCIVYRPLWNNRRALKYVFFSLGTTEMIPVNFHRYEGRSKSDPMLIRVSPFYANFNLSVYYLVILSPVMKYSARP